jgi:hypothetical protein
MTREPGCTFAVAPHFELPADWQQRLLIGTGVDETDGRFFPRGPWRAPDTAELSHLVAGVGGANASDTRVQLFKLPAHLCAQWWQLLERAGDDGAGIGRLPGYDAFLSQIADFLAFKGLAINDPVSCDIVITRPGQRSVRWDPEVGRALGLACTLPPQTPCASLQSQSRCGPRLWGAINLGDEPTSFVLIHPPCRAIAERLRRDFPERPPPATLGALIDQFLRACPDVSPVRVSLHPGEGLRLPCDALLADGFPQDKQEPDVLLLITESCQA